MIEHYRNKSLENIFEEINGIILTEEWRYIPNCEGEYSVSSYGRVKSHERYYEHPIKGNTFVSEKILSQKIMKNGYCRVQISIMGIKTKLYVHRLVGVAFLENEENKPEINHKWGIKIDNRRSELEWNTISENRKHAIDVLGFKPLMTYLGRVGELHHASKKVYCSTLGVSFGSAREAARELGISQGSVSNVCTGKQLHTDGLVFNYI